MLLCLLSTEPLTAKQISFRWSLLLLVACFLLNMGVCANAQTNVIVTTPTEAALDAALAQVATGGTVTFACDGTISITHTKKIAVNSSTDTPVTVTLDATGHNITLDGGGNTTLFAAAGILYNIMPAGFGYGLGDYGGTYVYKASWVFKHLALANSGSSAVTVTNGDVTASDCSFTNGGNIADNDSPHRFYAPGGNASFTNCVFTNNAAVSGGAVQSGVFPSAGYKSTSVTASHCTFLNNCATNGNGGAINSSGSVTLSNCTFVGNSAQNSSGNAYGGALYSAYSAILTNCTVANNSATANNSASGASSSQGKGGGIYNGAGTFSLTNTILANNTASTSGNNASGSLTDSGHNICSNNDCAFATTSSSLNNTNPRLGSLVYTQGATPTLALLANSPAIDAGDDTQAPTTDARGAARMGSHSDIGAYERPTWQTQALAVGPDGCTRLLWDKSDGTIEVCSIDTTTGKILTSATFSPRADWTALALSIGADNSPRLLFSNATGQMQVATLNETTGTLTYAAIYGPYAPWNAQTIAVDTANQSQILWTTPSNSMSLWSLDTTSNPTSNTLTYSPAYGSFAPWSAVGLAIDSANTSLVLWSAPGGLMSLWSLASVSASPSFSVAYPSDTSWTATGLSVGGDKAARVLWNRVDGEAGVWSVDVGTGAVDSGVAYVPAAGSAYTGLSTGSDNNTRLLCVQLDGTLVLSVVDTPTGTVLDAYTFPTP